MNTTRALCVALLLASACAVAQMNRTTADLLQQGDANTIADAGASDAYTGCPLFSIAAYKAGMSIWLKPNTANTGAASINVCGLGVKSIKQSDGTTDPTDGQLATGAYQLLTYDGTVFRIPAGSGGGGAPTSVTTVSYSATPTFTVPSATAQALAFKITLTGNVTSSTLASAVNGQVITIIVCQDATGGRSFVWPANVVNGMTINSTRNSAASLCVQQTFIYDGTNAVGPKEIGVDGSGNASIDQSNQIAVASLYPTMPTTATLSFPSANGHEMAGAGFGGVFSGAVNKVIVSMFTLESRRVISKGAMHLGGGALAGRQLTLGIYSVTSGPTCTLVAQFPMDVTATGVRTSTITAATLDPGVYYAASAGSDAALTVRWWNPDPNPWSNGELTAITNALSVPTNGTFTTAVMDASGNLPLNCSGGVTAGGVSQAVMAFGN